MAGLSVAAHAPQLLPLPPGLAALVRTAPLPPLGIVEFVMLCGEAAGAPAAELADAIYASIPRLAHVEPEIGNHAARGV